MADRHVVAILAISEAEAREMKKTIEQVRGEDKVRIVVCTEVRQVEGLRADEFIMTSNFQNQRSIRLLLTAIQSTRKRKVL